MSQRLTRMTTTGETTIEVFRGEFPKTYEEAQALLEDEPRPADPETPDDREDEE
jgi:hypothetical protein